METEKYIKSRITGLYLAGDMVSWLYYALRNKYFKR